MGCGVDKNSQSRTSCDVMLGDCTAMEALVPVEYGGFMLMPSNQDLTAAEVRLLGMIPDASSSLRNALKPIREDFDVILIDCPPALNMLTVNAPGRGGFGDGAHAMRVLCTGGFDLPDADHRADSSQHQYGSGNRRVLRTMFDPRNNLANEVSAQLIQHFGDKVFRTMIPRNVRLAEARVSASPRCFTTRSPAARWPIWPSPAR